MKDLFPGAVVRDEFQRWLNIGYGPFTIWQGEKALVMISSLEKTPSVNYLYRISPAQDNSISWDSSMLFCGVYDAEHGALYLTKDSLSTFMGGEFPPVSEVGPSVAGEISGRINRRIEETIANDRNNLSVREVTGWQAARDLQYYQEHGAQGEALEIFFDGRELDGGFHSGYTMDELPEAAFMAWLRDPEGFVQTEAEIYIKSHQEAFLLQFLKNDALVKEYQALTQDTGSVIHRMKAITDALRECGAKTVTVTVQKAGEELSFKTGTSCLQGYRSSYSAYHIAAPDRQEFERLFGRHSDYHVEDITRITYGKKTIYEAAPVQAEEPVQEIGMGGMM